MPIASSFWTAARPLRRFCAALFAASTALFAQSPSAADGFDPNVDGNVYAVATQADGKIILAGSFGTLRPNGSIGAVRNNLARINPDGSLDPLFNPNTNGAVRALVLQADGKIIIGGDFSSVQANGAATATSRSRLARLNADGSLDATFTPEVTGSPVAQVYALLLQPDGTLFVGGNFLTASPSVGGTGSLTRHHLAKFNANGFVDPTYDPEPDLLVFALAPHFDGKLVVAGGFTSFLPNNATVRTTRGRVARLNPDGTPDSEFDPKFDNRATALAIQRDGKILVGGDFGTVQPIGTDTPVTRNRFARLNADGTLDTAFTGSASGNIGALAVLPDGSILAGGSFTSVWSGTTAPASRAYVARYLPDGAVDLNFLAGANSIVAAFAPQPDGRVLIAGYFTGLQPRGAQNSIVRNRVARIGLDGALDATLNLDFGGRPLVEVVQKDGKILIGGSFTSVGGATHNHLARLNPDGSVDTTFKPDLNGVVLTMALQPADQKILIGGTFTTIGGETRNYIARLNPSGTIDSEFNPSASAQVGSIVLQADGKILIGGAFTTLQPIGVTQPKTRSFVARLNADGSLDAAFHPNPNSNVSAIAVQADGKILLGGNFNNVTPEADLTFTTTTAPTVATDKASTTSKTVGNVTTTTSITILNNVTTTTVNSTSPATSRNNLARFNADGTLDTTFDPNINVQVNAIAVQPDGKIVIGGGFTLLRPAGATTNTTRNRLARLNADGSIDPAFDPNANGLVLSLALQPDGKILVGGAFTTLTPNGATTYTLRKYAARLNADGTVDNAFNLDLNELNGNRVDSWLVLSDGRILIGGNFISMQPVGAAGRVSSPHFARLTASGTLDPTFVPGVGGTPSAQINALAFQADGKFVVAGSFTDLGGTTTANLARFTPEGLPDFSFFPAPGTDGPVNAVLARADAAATVPQGTGFAWLNTNGSIRTAFAPPPESRINGTVDAVAVQPDGSVIIGGSFTTPSAIPGANLVRFTPTGLIDVNFGPAPNGPISAIRVQADGKILITGGFTQIAGAARNYIARLNADGTIDAGFDPQASARVEALVLQADGKMVIGGSFTSLNPNATTNTTTTTTTTTPNAPSSTNTVTNADGSTVTTTVTTVSGTTTTTITTTTGSPVGRNYLARLNTDGKVDLTFNPNPNSTVNSLLIQPDGKVVVGGAFTVFQNLVTTISTTTTTPNAGSSSKTVTNANGTTTTTTVSTVSGTTTTTVTTSAVAVSRNRLARLNADGTTDNYDPNVNDAVLALALNPDGKVIAAGAFTSMAPNGGNGFTRNRIARLNTDGSMDTNFDPNIVGGSAIVALAVQSDARIVLGGNFTALQPNGATTATGRNRIARVNFDGSLDSTYNPDANGNIAALALAPDGTLVVGGTFTTLSPNPTLLIGGSFNSIGGVAAKNLALLGEGGATNANFLPTPNGPVTALLAQPDGKYLVGGSFTTIAGATRSGLARFNSDNTLDTAFNPSVVGAITALALQADGKVLAATASAVRRFNADGTADASFTAGAGSLRNFRALALQADGKILFIGQTSVTSPLDQLGRWNADGSVDATFATVGSPANTLQTLSLQTDGRIVVGGGFTSLNAGSVLRLARLTSAGALEAGFNPAPDGAVTALALQGDGRVLIGGSFTSVGGLPRGSLARLAATTPASQALSATRTTLVLARAGGGPEISGVAFEQSTDLQTWTKLGSGGRVGATGNWQLNGLNLPASGLFYVRARSLAPTGGGTSSGVIETIRQFNLAATPGVGPASSTVATQDIGGVLIDSVTGLITGQSTAGGLPGMTSAPIGTVAQSVIVANGFNTGDVRLTNFSARARLRAGGVLQAGFAVSGAESRTLLLRAAGPSLGAFGVTGVLASPRLQLLDATGKLLRENSGWAATPANLAEVSAAGTRTGAFPFAANAGNDAAMVVTLPPGTYSVQVLDAGGAGGITLAEIYDAGDSASGSRLVNLSIRGDVNPGEGAFLSGFVLTGQAARRMLVRGDGPSLTQFGVPGALSDPMVSVFSGSGQLLASNDNWSSTVGDTLGANLAALQIAARSVGAYNLDVGSKDAALTLTLVPGTYTVQVSAATAATGAALIEIYELP